MFWTKGHWHPLTDFYSTAKHGSQLEGGSPVYSLVNQAQIVRKSFRQVRERGRGWILVKHIVYAIHDKSIN